MAGASVDDRGGAPAAAQPTGQPWSNRVTAASKPACVRWMHPARRRVWLDRHRSSLVARDAPTIAQPAVRENGRAQGRERACQYGWIGGGAESLKDKWE